MSFLSQPDPNWCIVEKHFDIKQNRHYESVFSLGTGYMTTRASIEEGFDDDNNSFEYERHMDNTTLEKVHESKSRWGTFIPVIQAEHPNLRTGIVNLPYYLGLVIRVDNEKLDLEKSHLEYYLRWLDLKSGTLYRHVIWKTQQGKLVEIMWRRYMNLDERFSCVQDVRLKVDQNVDVLIESFVDNDVRTNGYDKFVRTLIGSQDHLIYSEVETNLGNHILTASQCGFNQVGDNTLVQGDRQVTSQTAFRLDSEKWLQIHKVSFTASDLYYEQDDLLSAAQAVIHNHPIEQSELSFERHTELWQQNWEKVDIQIEAKDPQEYNSQLAIRTALFHILKAKGLDDRALLCPKGATTEMYFGSVFWDYEIFMLPFFIYNYPDIARTAPTFRYSGLESARKLAKWYGYNGAKYPWQSDRFGNETCVPWQYADHQVHISASVVVGLWHYVCATGDIEFLHEFGAEIIIETARYWVDRVDTLPGRSGYHILGVMGPDEYKPITNNNAYTNYVARFNLEIAVHVVEKMKVEAPEKFTQLSKKISFGEDEIAQFKQIASGITLPKDEDDHIIWQCDDFDAKFAEVDIDGLWKDRTRLFGSYLSQEKRYRSKVIKQADVLALIGVFPSAFSELEKAASFQYYEPYTIHDSSNSMTHRQMVAANLGWKQLAYESWLRAIDIDFGSLPRSSEGLHYANIGGMWQQIVMGFGGFMGALNSDHIVFSPCLPSQIHSIKFPLTWKGHSLWVVVRADSLLVENRSSEAIEVTVGNQKHIVPAGQKVEAAY
jgi:kojibiose phosphorylase